MGLLTEGKALTPEEMKDVGHYIREHGITQFLHTWGRVKDLQNDELRFGDEIECGLVVVDNEKKTAKISVRSAEVSADDWLCFFTFILLFMLV
jgi:glutamate--cysteine ligase catalytic subunit